MAHKSVNQLQKITQMQLPDELIFELMNQLHSTRDILAFGSTCKHLNTISQDPHMWPISPKESEILKDLKITNANKHAMVKCMQKPEEFANYNESMVGCGIYGVNKGGKRMIACNTAKELLELREMGFLMEGGRVSVISDGKEIGAAEHAHVLERVEDCSFQGHWGFLMFDSSDNRFYAAYACNSPNGEGRLLYRGVKGMTPEIAIQLMIQKGDWASWMFCDMYMVVGTTPIVFVGVTRYAEEQCLVPQIELQSGFAIHVTRKIPLVYGVHCEKHTRGSFPHSTLDFAEKHGLLHLYT